MIRKALRIGLTVMFCLSILGFGPLTTPALARPSAAGIPLSSVPVEFVKLATQQLEDMRGSQMAPNWDATAVLDSNVVPLLRPDIAGKPAYFEFTVLISGSKPAGFIIVSTGPHDFPIPHWDDQGLSPTADLDAQAATKGLSLVNYYRLDALSYAGEDKNGVDLMTNDKLIKIDGLGPNTLVPNSSSTNWTPAPSADDSSPDPAGGKLTQSGPQKGSFTFSPWASWNELKSGYAQTYGFLLAHLADNAGKEWDLLNRAEQFGERLSLGDQRDIAVLCSDPSNIQVNGDGKTFVTTTLLVRSGLHPLYHITVNKDEYPLDHPLSVAITCLDTGVVTYNFVIAAPTYHLVLPVIQTAPAKVVPAGTPATAAAPTAKVNPQTSQPASASPTSNPRLAGDWGPWSYAWAFNGGGDARLYDQMAAGTFINTTSCYSGCGATAWGMLFGWADYEARAANTWNYWKARPGIYRVGGGTGADAIAPQFPDDGVRFMIWTIRNFIGTFCMFDSGATFPWSMSNAWQYLAPRTGARLETHYNVVGWSEGGLRDLAVNSLRYRQTPAVIGTGWLNHYPLAMGYAERSRTVRACDFCWWDTTETSRWFWVNQGWGGNGNGWVSADTWFDGELYP